MKEYCYKIKCGWLKQKRNNDYSKAKIEQFGFKKYLPEDEADTEIIWAKGLHLSPSCSLANWMKHDLEKIYKSGQEKWLEELRNSGYEFDPDGKLVENEAFLTGLDCQLCISANGDMKGCLFINIEGAEFYEAGTLEECAPGDIIKLVGNNVIYKKRMYEQ